MSTARSADVLIVGAGVAGLCAALGAAPRRVLLLCPAPPVESSSSALAQGGVAAPIGPGDSPEAHVRDTLEAASHSADPKAVRRIIGAAAAAVGFLESSGVVFDRGHSGRSLHLEAGHGRPRVAHAAGDRSGATIVAALWARALAAPHIEVLSGSEAIQLLVHSPSGVSGVLVVAADGRPAVIHANETVLATGGIGRLFARTTNGHCATGDGLAMALAAGARTAALEFVQFHPTALRVADDPLPLLTEALRGAGARLVTGNGAPVMAGRHPLGDLAPRDIVARAVFEQAAAGEEVLLDATRVFGGALGEEFPGARTTALRYGLDPAVSPLPITAAAHYHMGGVVVDARGRTSLPGLWACGEVAFTGLHGANRLASNSLLEAVVCGRALGAAIATTRTRSPTQRAADAVVANVASVSATRFAGLRERMWSAMGPMRDGDTLRAALSATRQNLGSLRPEEIVLRQRFGLAAAMIEAAANREESRGAHSRRDFPQRDVTRDGAQAVYPWSASRLAGRRDDAA